MDPPDPIRPRLLRPLDLPASGVRGEAEAAVQPLRGVVRLGGDDPPLGAAVRSPAGRNPHEVPGQSPTPVVDRRDPATGTGLSHYLTLHGLVHHTTYHAGQIALLRRAIEARVS